MTLFEYWILFPSFILPFSDSSLRHQQTVAFSKRVVLLSRFRGCFKGVWKKRKNDRHVNIIIRIPISLLTPEQWLSLPKYLLQSPRSTPSWQSTLPCVNMVSWRSDCWWWHITFSWSSAPLDFFWCVLKKSTFFPGAGKPWFSYCEHDPDGKLYKQQRHHFQPDSFYNIECLNVQSYSMSFFLISIDANEHLVSYHFSREIEANWRTNWIQQSVFLPLWTHTCFKCNFCSWRRKARDRSRVFCISCVHVVQVYRLLRNYRSHSMAHLLGSVLRCIDFRDCFHIHDRLHSILFRFQGFLFHLVVSSQVQGCPIGLF